MFNISQINMMLFMYNQICVCAIVYLCLKVFCLWVKNLDIYLG